MPSLATKLDPATDGDMTAIQRLRVGASLGLAAVLDPAANGECGAFREVLQRLRAQRDVHRRRLDLQTGPRRQGRARLIRQHEDRER